MYSLELIEKFEFNHYYKSCLDAETNVCVPCVVKLKRGGLSRPLGSLRVGTRSSSKKAWAQASRGVSRAVGVYSSNREHRAIASGGVFGRNT